MTHDSARLSALVDGELDHAERDRVLAHLAQCEECRAIVESERRVRALLGGLADSPAVRPSEDFLRGLIGLGAGGDGAPGTPGADARPVGDPSGGIRSTAPEASGRVVAPAGRAAAGPSRRPMRAVPFSEPPLRRRPGRYGDRPGAMVRPASRRRRRVIVGVAGVASAVGMTAALAFALGGTTNQPPVVDIAPPLEQFSVEHAGTVSEYPLWDPGTLSDPFGQLPGVGGQ